MVINVYNEYSNKIEFDFEKIISDIEGAFETEKELSLILVDLDEITRINREYRNKDYATDVISFEDEEDEEYLGDIFISIDKAIEQAKEYGHSIEREFAFLLVHGVLHLHGYDHIEYEEEQEMFKLQKEILERLNYKRWKLVMN